MKLWSSHYRAHPICGVTSTAIIQSETEDEANELVRSYKKGYAEGWSNVKEISADSDARVLFAYPQDIFDFGDPLGLMPR